MWNLIAKIKINVSRNKRPENAIVSSHLVPIKYLKEYFEKEKGKLTVFDKWKLMSLREIFSFGLLNKGSFIFSFNIVLWRKKWEMNYLVVY